MFVQVVDVSAIVAQVGDVAGSIGSHFSRPIVIVTDVDDTTAELVRTRLPIAATDDNAVTVADVFVVT